MLNHYFTLDTASINYRVMKGDTLVSYIQYNKEGDYFHVDDLDSEELKTQAFEYDYIKNKLGKEPIQFNTGLCIPSHPRLDMDLKFGYTENGRLMLFKFYSRDVNINDGKEGLYVLHNTVKLEYGIMSMEDYFFKEGSYTYLKQIIERSYKASINLDKKEVLYPR